MTNDFQLDFFEEENELSLLRKEIKENRHYFEKFKKNLYARHRELSLLCLQLKEENEILHARLEQIELLIHGHKQGSENEALLEQLFQEAYLSQTLL